MPSRATIDGIPILTSTPVAWALTAGSQPYQTAVAVAKKAVKNPDDLVGKKTTLSVSGDKDGFTASCYILGVTQGAHPETLLLALSDKRWLWPRTHVLRRYNVRRKTGNRRLLTEGVPQALTLTVDDYYYEVATLHRKKERWTIETAIRDVLGSVDDGPIETGGVKFLDVPFENVEVDDPGDAAIDRIRSLASGLNVYVALDGTTTLIDETDLASATAALRQFGDPVVGRGIAAKTNRAGIRPAYVDVLFSVEQELKFVNVTEGDTYSRRANTEKYIENVVQVPDITLTLADGRVVTRGTWITVDEAFAAWNSSRASFPAPGAGIDLSGYQWSHDTVQTYWLEGHLEQIFTAIGTVSGSRNDEMARLAAIRHCYRTTYRISPYWMNRIAHLFPYRVAIIDEENGTRAPARIFANYAYSPSVRGVFADPSKAGWILNEDGIYSDSLAACGFSPATLSIEDEQLGIVRFNFQLASTNIWQQVYPCLIGNPPAADYRKGKTSPVVTGGAVYGSVANAPRLASGHKCGFVLTASPSAPNSNDQLYRVRVTAAEAGGMGIHSTPATGPGMEVRVGIGSTAAGVARFMWSDDSERFIDEFFGKSSDGTGGRPSYAAGAALERAGLLIGADETHQIAKSIAAAVYSSLTDRVVGTQAMRLGKATLKPTGNLVEVVFGIDSQGAMNTTGNFNPTAGRVDVTSLLSADVRRKLLRLAQP